MPRCCAGFRCRWAAKRRLLSWHPSSPGSLLPRTRRSPGSCCSSTAAGKRSSAATTSGRPHRLSAPSNRTADVARRSSSAEVAPDAVDLPRVGVGMERLAGSRISVLLELRDHRAVPLDESILGLVAEEVLLLRELLIGDGVGDVEVDGLTDRRVR